MNFEKFSEETTIYQYKLIKKISHWNVYTGCYAFLLVLFTAVFIHQFRLVGLISIFAGYAFLQLVHCSIIWAVSAIRPQSPKQEWTFQFCFPWIGLLPASFTSFLLLKRTYWHLFIIGFASIGSLYPWLPAEVTETLCFLHVWMLMPRFAIFWLLRKQKAHGLIKLSTNETSFYIP